MLADKKMSKALQRLLTGLVDTELDFDMAAESTRSFRYYAEFEQDAGRRRKLKNHIISLIRGVGRQPDTAGSLHGFIKRSLAGLSHHRFRTGKQMRFLEREEAQLARTIRVVLANRTLPEEIRNEAVELLEALFSEEARLEALDTDHAFTLRDGR